MKALIGTEIIRFKQREPKNETMKNLFYWLEKLSLDKVIHSDASIELGSTLDYEILTVVEPHEAFIDSLPKAGETAEEKSADAMLFAVHSKIVQALITEDGRTLANASAIGLGDRVVNINRFISRALYRHPELIKYTSLAVKPTTFGECDISDEFFDSFKQDYEGFEDWFQDKADKEAYICKGDNDAYLGFLYLKLEDEKEDYSDIIPVFEPKRRLKVGTMKVESSGFRLGERFIQIIFDHAQKYNVDEIYVTLFKEREEVQRLYELLRRWGFVEYGFKSHKNGRAETVMVKHIEYDARKTVQANFPAVQYRKRKLYLPIMEKFHKRLIPDAERKEDFVTNEACRYALEKVYITTATHNPVKNGDLIVVYRMGDTEPKHYSSIVTAVGVIKEMRTHFNSKEDFMNECQNRSVFTTAELETLWRTKSSTLGVVRFLTIRTFNTRPPLRWLREQGFFAYNEGPRPFTEMSDAQFDAILQEAGATDIKWF